MVKSTIETTEKKTVSPYYEIGESLVDKSKTHSVNQSFQLFGQPSKNEEPAMTHRLEIEEDIQETVIENQ